MDFSRFGKQAEAEPGVPELGALPAPDRSVAIRAPDGSFEVLLSWKSHCVWLTAVSPLFSFPCAARRVNLAYHSDDTVAMAMERLGRILGYQARDVVFACWSSLYFLLSFVVRFVGDLWVGFFFCFVPGGLCVCVCVCVCARAMCAVCVCVNLPKNSIDGGKKRRSKISC